MPRNSGFITGEQVRVIRTPVDGEGSGPPVGTIGTVLRSGGQSVRVRYPQERFARWESRCERLELVMSEGDQPYAYDDVLTEGMRVGVARFPVGGSAVNGPPLGATGTVISNSHGSVSVQFDDWREDDDETVSTWACYVDRLMALEPPAFYLVMIQDKKVVRVGTYTFGNGKAAAEMARRLTEEYGCKVQPRRIAADANSDEWRERERVRFGNGEYIAMPAEWDLSPITDHFLHPSRDDPTKLAFIESPEKGVLDRQTRVTPGRYLERYYPHLSQVERNRYIAMIDKPDGLHFAITADDIVMTYTRGPSSCMSHHTEKFQSRPIHPVKPYAGGDLQVAYLMRDGTVTARALAWPERKLYGRPYGDIARIERALQDAGYKHGPLIGARLVKIWHEDYKRYIAPYIDYQKCLHDPDPDKHEGFLVIPEEGHGELSARHTDGFAHPMKRCPRLGLFFPGHFFPVQISDTVVEQWSERAVSEYAVLLYDEDRGREYYYPRERTVELDGHGPVLIEQIDRYAVRSDLSGEMIYKGSAVTLIDGRKCSPREFRYNYGIVCKGSRKCVLPEHGYTLAGNGSTYSHAYLDETAAKMGLTRDAVLEKVGGARRVREAKASAEEVAEKQREEAILEALENEGEDDDDDEIDDDIEDDQLDAA
ncbi:hypothetical protein PUR29_34885 [Methylobacterium ajmalii]|uniref:Uncharacterized protein n=1 Tax=Methylobacterium ajmalii TaxID=2738439 RepID=A0ABV0A7F9_9HYPH